MTGHRPQPLLTIAIINQFEVDAHRFTKRICQFRGELLAIAGTLNDPAGDWQPAIAIDRQVAPVMGSNNDAEQAFQNRLCRHPLHQPIAVFIPLIVFYQANINDGNMVMFVQQTRLGLFQIAGYLHMILVPKPTADVPFGPCIVFDQQHSSLMIHVSLHLELNCEVPQTASI